MPSKWVQRLPPFTVYKIIDKSNNQTIYVGLTKRTLKARLQAHSDHKESPISALIKAKGKQNFSITAIDYAGSQKEGWIKEEFWTVFLLKNGHPLRNKYYGRRASEEIRKIQSIVQKGHPTSEAQRMAQSKANKGRFMGIEHLRSKCVRCVETNEVYGSISEASRMTGAGISNIAYVCRGKLKSAGGYHWVYATREEYFLCHQKIG